MSDIPPPAEPGQREFSRESELTPIAASWLRGRGLHVEAEVATSWGICDLLGARLNPDKVQMRLELGQNRSLGSMDRVALWLQLPDAGQRPYPRATTLARRVGLCDSDVAGRHLPAMEAAGFVHSEGGAFHRLNGWMPLHSELIAVELKLSRVSEVLDQATANATFATESFVGLPHVVASRVADSSLRDEFARRGVGLLAITSSTCDVLLPAQKRAPAKTSLIETHLVEWMWKRVSATQRQASVAPQ